MLDAYVITILTLMGIWSIVALGLNAVFVPPVSTAKNNSTSVDLDADFITPILPDMEHQCAEAFLLLRWPFKAVFKCP